MLRMTAEKYPVKGRKLYVAFMDLEKMCYRIHWNAMCDVLKNFGVGGQLLHEGKGSKCESEQGEE